jgi:hypothetical protein
LGLVQDFLNTRAGEITGPDLLCDAAHANEWGAHAVQTWSARRGIASRPPTMTNHDAAMLGHVRDTIDELLAGIPTDDAIHPHATTELVVADTGEIFWNPTGSGWRWYYCALLGEILLSQRTRTWQRLKQCRNDDCRAAMYDSSWNNSAVWHNRRACDPSLAANGVLRC